MTNNDNFDPLNPKRPGTNDEGYYDATHPPPPDVPNPYHIGVTVTDMGDPLPPDPTAPAAVNAARETTRRTYDTLRQEGAPRVIAWIVSAFAGSASLIIAGLTAAIAWTLAAVAPKVALVFLKAITESRKAVDPAIPEMAAEILSELTGADLKAEHVPTGKGFADHLKRVTIVGDTLHNLLEGEFVQAGKVTPDSGAQAARAFTGFNVNFGIGTALIGLLGEIESLGTIQDLRELGVEVARNLGLGRLHRLALTPLIKTTIQTPYTWHLNDKYRPTRLPEAKLIQAFYRQAIDEATLRTELGQEGYSEERINLLLADARPRLSVANITELYYRGYFSEPTLKQELGHLGWADYQIDALVLMQRPQLEKNEVIHLYEGGEIELPEALDLLAHLGYDDKTAHRVITAYELAHQPSVKTPKFHTKHLSVGELKKAYIDANIDLTEYQDYLVRLGYSPEDVTTLTLDLLFDAKHHAELEKAKADKAAAIAAKNSGK